MYLPLSRVHLKKIQQRTYKSNDAHVMFLKVYVGTHLNCIDKSMQFKWVPTTNAFIKK